MCTVVLYLSNCASHLYNTHVRLQAEPTCYLNQLFVSEPCRTFNFDGKHTCIPKRKVSLHAIVTILPPYILFWQLKFLTQKDFCSIDDIYVIEASIVNVVVIFLFYKYYNLFFCYTFSKHPTSNYLFSFDIFIVLCIPLSFTVPSKIKFQCLVGII